MHTVVARMDDIGRPAWLVAMVLGFIVFWPIGLGILAYILWSGRMGRMGHMGCSSWRGDVEQWRDRAAARWEHKRERWMRSHGLPATGNRAFDEYREESLRKLEAEAAEFRAFLERLRMAKDRAEFDDFMRDRRDRPAGSAPGSAQGPEPQPQS